MAHAAPCDPRPSTAACHRADAPPQGGLARHPRGPAGERASRGTLRRRLDRVEIPRRYRTQTAARAAARYLRIDERLFARGAVFLSRIIAVARTAAGILVRHAPHQCDARAA